MDVIRSSGFVVGLSDGINDGLLPLVTDLLIVVYDIAQVIASAVVRFPYRHGVMGEVDVAVIAEVFRHGGRLGLPLCLLL